MSGDGRGGRFGHVFHGSADDGFEGIAVFLYGWDALGHDEEGSRAGAEIVRDCEVPEGGIEE